MRFPGPPDARVNNRRTTSLSHVRAEGHVFGTLVSEGQDRPVRGLTLEWEGNRGRTWDCALCVFVCVCSRVCVCVCLLFVHLFIWACSVFGVINSKVDDLRRSLDVDCNSKFLLSGVERSVCRATPTEGEKVGSSKTEVGEVGTRGPTQLWVRKEKGSECVKGQTKERVD